MKAVKPARKFSIAVVGDVHDLWDQHDTEAITSLNVDLVLFVGDFGNENVSLVRQIAAVPLPKAVTLGNHDAWYTATQWGRKKCPYDRAQVDWVQDQLDALGETHVGFSYLDCSDLGLAVVGSRPFSWGGPKWQNKSFYRDRYQVNSFAESTERIVTAGLATTQETLILLGHCGPAGLGEHAEDPCGRDWHPLGGDYGDPDFAQAIQSIRQAGKAIPLVTFGHMHHHLRHRQDRLRRSLVVDEFGTVYLNAARAPRVRQTDTGVQRNFSIVTFQDAQVVQVKLVWLNVENTVIQAEQLYMAQPLVQTI